MSSNPTSDSMASDARPSEPEPKPEAKPKYHLLWHGVAILTIVSLLVATVIGSADSRNRPLKIIVPFAAGGGSDTFVRMIQKAISDEKLTDRPLVIINQKGGSGTIGSRTVKTARPNDSTILFLHEAIMTAKLSDKVDYGPEAFEPIAATGRVSMMVIVPADSKFKSLKQMLDHAKAEPNTIRFGANIGAPAHFTGLLLERAVPGAKFREVQSGGGQERYTLLIGGHLEMGVFSLDEFIAYRGGGKIRALAILDAEPNAVIPKVPTAKQQGIDVVHHNTNYWWAPKDTPADRINAIADLLERAMNSDQVKARLARINTEPLFVRGEPLKQLIAQRTETLGRVDLRAKADLPNFPLIVGCIVIALAVLVIVLQVIGRAKEASASSKSTEASQASGQVSGQTPAQLPAPGKARKKLALAVAGVTLLYVLLLQLRIVRFAIATTLFVLIVGALLGSSASARLDQAGQTNKPRKPWMALGEVALLCGLGLEFVFTRVLIIDLP